MTQEQVLTEKGDLSPSLANARIRVVSELVVGPGLRRGARTIHYIKKQGSSSFYRVGEREAFLIGRLDGRRTVAEISAEYLERFHRRLGPTSWQPLLMMLGSRGLLEGTEVNRSPDPDAPPAAPAARLKNLLAFRLPLVRAPERIERLTPHLAILFSRPVFAILLALSAGACVYALSHWRLLWATWQSSPDIVLATVVAYVALWVTMLAHELGHAIACAHFGGRAREFGVMWRFPLLVPYCKADDIVLFPRRGQRVATAFAGTFVSMLAAIPAVGGWILIPAGRWHDVAGAVLLVAAVGAVLNLVPIFQLDGYAMLNHALGMADLRADTYQFWAGLIRRTGRLDAWPASSRTAYACYGVFSAFLLGALLVVLAVVGARALHLTRDATIAVGGGAAVASLAVTLLLVVTVGKYAGAPARSLSASLPADGSKL